MLPVFCFSATLALQPFSLLSHSQLVLADRRILVTAPRIEAGPLAAALIEAGARPIWYPTVRISPLSDGDLELLDDSLMRLAEFDVILLPTRHAIDAVALRGTKLADGDASVLTTMMEASCIDIATFGALSRHMTRELGLTASVVPFVSSFAGMVETLAQVGGEYVNRPDHRTLSRDRLHTSLAPAPNIGPCRLLT